MVHFHPVPGAVQQIQVQSRLGLLSRPELLFRPGMPSRLELQAENDRQQWCWGPRGSRGISASVPDVHALPCAGRYAGY